MKLRIHYQTDHAPMDAEERDCLLYYPEVGLNPSKQIDRASDLVDKLVAYDLDSITIVSDSPFFTQVFIDKFENYHVENKIEFKEENIEYYIDGKPVGNETNSEYWRLMVECVEKKKYMGKTLESKIFDSVNVIHNTYDHKREFNEICEIAYRGAKDFCDKHKTLNRGDLELAFQNCLKELKLSIYARSVAGNFVGQEFDTKSPTIILTTNDGVEITNETIEVWWITSDFIIHKVLAGTIRLTPGILIFSTKAKAEEHVILNKKLKTAQNEGIETQLTVYLFEEDEHTIAYCPALDLSGYGMNEEEAKSDLSAVLTEYFIYTNNKKHCGKTFNIWDGR